MRPMVFLLVCALSFGVSNPDLCAQDEPIRKLDPVDPEEAEMAAAFATLFGGFAGGTLLTLGALDTFDSVDDEIFGFTGAAVLTLALSVGPSTGLMMGDMWTRGILSSLGRVGAFTFGLFLIALGSFELDDFCDPTFEECNDPLLSEGELVMGLGAVSILTGLAWGFYDIGDTDEQIIKRQRAFLPVSVGLAPVEGGALLTFSLSR